MKCDISFVVGGHHSVGLSINKYTDPELVDSLRTAMKGQSLTSPSSETFMCLYAPHRHLGNALPKKSIFYFR